jgi:hypothetical protein
MRDDRSRILEKQADSLPARLAAGAKALAHERGAEGQSLVGSAMRMLPWIGSRWTSAATKVYEKGRAADLAVSGQLARIPLLGRAFRTFEDLPGEVLKETPHGPIRSFTRNPTTSLAAPVEKVQEFAVPMLAFSALSGAGAVGAHAATRAPAPLSERKNQMDTKHGQILKAAAVVMRQREELLEKTARDLADHKAVMMNLAGSVKKAEFEKKATTFVLDMVRRGIVSVDKFEEKVAEIVGKGEHALEVQREALTMIDKDASSLGTAEDNRSGGDDEAGEGNPALEYLEQYAHAYEG